MPLIVETSESMSVISSSSFSSAEAPSTERRRRSDTKLVMAFLAVAGLEGGGGRGWEVRREGGREESKGGT